MPCVQHCSATCGASRLATAQALGGFMISAPRPETSHLLLEESSQAGASGGKNLDTRAYHSTAWRTGSDLTVMLPLASTSAAPNDWETAPAASTESGVVPSPMPNANPPLWSASCALANASNVQASALGGLPTG